MPLTSQWWIFAEGVISLDKEAPGVYEFGDASGRVIYIGSSNSLRRRLLEHLRVPGTCVRRNATQYRLEYNSNYAARERELYDAYVRAMGRPPQCNEVRPGS